MLGEELMSQHISFYCASSFCASNLAPSPAPHEGRISWKSEISWTQGSAYALGWSAVVQVRNRNSGRGKESCQKGSMKHVHPTDAEDECARLHSLQAAVEHCE